MGEKTSAVSYGRQNAEQELWSLYLPVPNILSLCVLC